MRSMRVVGHWFLVLLVGCEVESCDPKPEPGWNPPDVVTAADEIFDLEPEQVLALGPSSGANPFANDSYTPGTFERADSPFSVDPAAWFATPSAPSGGSLTPLERRQVGPALQWLYTAPAVPGSYTIPYTVEGRSVAGAEALFPPATASATTTIRVVDDVWGPEDDIYLASALPVDAILVTSTGGGAVAGPLLDNDTMFEHSRPALTVTRAPQGLLELRVGDTVVRLQNGEPVPALPIMAIDLGEGATRPTDLPPWSWSYTAPEALDTGAGSDSFVYALCTFGWTAANGICREATVTILGAQGYVAIDDTATVDDDGSVQVSPGDNDLAGGAPRDIVSVTPDGPTAGSAVITGGAIVYTPAADGEDGDDIQLVTYIVRLCDPTDATRCAESELAITITADPPAAQDDAVTTSGATTVPVITNDLFDRPFEPGSLTLVGPAPSTPTIVDPDAGTITVTPDAPGTTTVRYRVADRFGQTTEAELTVEAVADACADFVDPAEPANDSTQAPPLFGASELYADSSLRQTIRLDPGELDAFTFDLRLYGTCAVDTLYFELAEGWQYDAVGDLWTATGPAIGAGTFEITVIRPDGSQGTIGSYVGAPEVSIAINQQDFGLESYGLRLHSTGSTCLAGSLLLTAGDCLPN